MSRRTRERRLRAEKQWPTLYQFLAAYCHQDWRHFHGTPSGAIDAAIADHPLGARQKVLREWRDWNGSEGAKHDPRAAVNDGLGVEVSFESPEEARLFMNLVYDKLIVSVRRETKAIRKPEWQK